MYKTLQIMGYSPPGINYQPQLVIAGFFPSTEPLLLGERWMVGFGDPNDIEPQVFAWMFHLLCSKRIVLTGKLGEISNKFSLDTFS